MNHIDVNNNLQSHHCLFHLFIFAFVFLHYFRFPQHSVAKKKKRSIYYFFLPPPFAPASLARFFLNTTN